MVDVLILNVLFVDIYDKDFNILMFVIEINGIEMFIMLFVLEQQIRLVSEEDGFLDLEVVWVFEFFEKFIMYFSS